MEQGTGDRFALGNAEIIALRDTSGQFPLAAVFPDVPPAAWPPFRERYPAAFDGDDLWRFNAHLTAGCHACGSSCTQGIRAVRSGWAIIDQNAVPNR